MSNLGLETLHDVEMPRAPRSGVLLGRQVMQRIEARIEASRGPEFEEIH